MTDNPTLADLRVLDEGVVDWSPWSRPATREDILAVIKELGGVEVWWCEIHESTGDGFCRFVDGHIVGHPRFDPPPTECRMVKRLIIPLDES